MSELDAGPELDAEIARRVMGLPNVRQAPWGDYAIYSACRHNDCSDPVPEYSTDIAAAWSVVEWAQQLRDRHGLIELCYGYGSDDWCVSIWPDYERGRIEAYGPTAPLAICRAALKSLEGTVA